MQDSFQITKETQRAILKVIADLPISSVDEISTILKEHGKNISKEEITQVIKSISPTKNWTKISENEIKNEMLNFIWTLECQILFNLSSKQKETTVSDFNQLRISNQQLKVSKDLIKQLQMVLGVDGKNLSRFRKFENEKNSLDDVDINTQVLWALRVILSKVSPDEINSIQELSDVLNTILNNDFPKLSTKAGKTTQRIIEKFTERYFSLDTDLKNKIQMYQSIYNTCKNGLELDSSLKNDNSNFSKLSEEIIGLLDEIKNDSNNVEKGFLSKIFSAKIKNQESILQNIEAIKNKFSEVKSMFDSINKSVIDKTLLMQKNQGDLDSILMLKGKAEIELDGLNEKVLALQNLNQSYEKEITETKEKLEKANEKIAALQQRNDQSESLQSNFESVRSELNAAKELSVRLYKRVNKLKADVKESILN